MVPVWVMSAVVMTPVWVMAVVMTPVSVVHLVENEVDKFWMVG